MKRARVQKPVKSGTSAKESVQVFCRVRPHPGSRSGDGEPVGCLRVVPPCHLHLVQPPSYRNGLPKELQYQFQKVFDCRTTQKEIFEEVALPQIKNLLAGRNSLLMTYGVTGSGKTYTMNGNLKDGGIMPRCFDVIFDSVYDFLAKRHIFKPDRLNSFDVQSIEDADAEAEIQTRVNYAKVNRLEKKNSDPDLAQRVRDEIRALPVDTDNCFAVFITYVEIYNNLVYDLLEDIFEENTRIRPAQTKIVREDSNHQMFVHGVNEIEVSSTDEALEAYHFGQKRRRIAQTALNTESSRSHSIFTIRLVQAPANDLAETSNETAKANMIVSQLSLVDLAGSERTNRTKNQGMRLKEAGNINNSLLTLRTCLELLRENQNGANKMIPYRDSRLTHLFKTFFDGDGQVTMIICVSPIIEECEETMQVLKFAEMSQEIQTTVFTPHKALCTPGSRKRIREDVLELAVKEFDELEKEARGDFLKISRNDELFDKIPDIRFFEMNDDKMIPSIKRYISDELAKVEMIKKNMNFQIIRNNIVKAERDAYVATCEAQALKRQADADKENIAVLESKLQAAENAQVCYKRKCDEADLAMKKLKTEVKRKNMEQDRIKEECASKLIQMKTEKAAWESEMKEKGERIRIARQLLNAEKNVPSFATPARSRVPPSKSVESIPSSLRGVSVAGVKNTLFNGTPSISAVTNTPHHHQVNGISNTPRSTARRAVPVVNRRYRRSRSVDNDVWLEHRPVHEVPTNTVMQPVMNRRKSITKLTDAKDVTEKTNKYCLLTQNQDSDGDLETRLYKGDVIPTAGGGAQVMFNDVEVLKQVSPSGSPTRKTPKQIRQDWEAACAQQQQQSEPSKAGVRSRNRRLLD